MTVGINEGDVLAIVGPAHSPAVLLHLIAEILLGRRRWQDLLYASSAVSDIAISTIHYEIPQWPALCYELPWFDFGFVHMHTLGWNAQLMIPADVVIDPFDMLQILLAGMDLMTVCEGHRIDNEVIMQVLPVDVRDNEDLVLWPDPLCKLYANGMRLCSSHFSRWEGLNVMRA